MRDAVRGRCVTNQPLGGAMQKYWERMGVWDLALFMVAASCSWLLAHLVVQPGVSVSVIPTLTALTIRHFMHGKQEDEHAPKHPAVKFLLGAWNEGDFDEVEKYVAPSCAIEMNGFAYDTASEGDGPAMVKESLEYWRAVIPDLEMELLHEIREKDLIAIEWSITGTHTGDRPELPASGNAIELGGSALLTIDDDKIVEITAAFDGLALAVQTGATEAPAWWPGRT